MRGCLKFAIAAAALVVTGEAEAKIPFFNATCPGKIEVHADQGGPVYINGKQGKLKVVNDSYYEAKGAGVTISVAVNPDGTVTVSYTGRKGANGICEVKE